MCLQISPLMKPDLVNITTYADKWIIRQMDYCKQTTIPLLTKISLCFQTLFQVIPYLKELEL